MRMLKWIYGVISLDRIRNEYLRGSLGVTEIDRKIIKNKLRWFRCAERKNNDEIVKKMGVK